MGHLFRLLFRAADACVNLRIFINQLSKIYVFIILLVLSLLLLLLSHSYIFVYIMIKSLLLRARVFYSGRCEIFVVAQKLSNTQAGDMNTGVIRGKPVKGKNHGALPSL